ncbi:MAG TPA: VWA domain-containing protein [Vicinamibacterales bacterium]|nr:VWA domain-containing protein [Vicinamibacterales bacterium]
MTAPLIAAACVAAVVVSAGQGQRTVFRSGVDLVTFGVTVVDGKGNVVTGLVPEDFELYEDGQRQELEYVLPGDADPASAGPGAALRLGVLFDISGSMQENLNLARSAAIKFLGALEEAQDYTLVEFDIEIRVARFGRAEFPRLVERIRNRKAEGYTALWDATGVYLDGASSQEGRKILVLYTDGDDNSSNIRFGELLDLVKASDVTVHAIGFLEHQSARSRMDSRLRLKQVAELTGGQAFFPTSLKDLDAAYERVAAEIAGQYILGYISSNTRPDGTWRKVEIKPRAGLKGVKFRARSGYFAPLKETGPG